ncbi:MAG: hypothetical protein WC089_03760 [Candidatus Paceibacterota bacterium]
MYDIETAAKEFEYLRDKIKCTLAFMVDEEYVEAAFTLGRLYALCQSRADQLENMLPDEGEENEK